MASNKIKFIKFFVLFALFSHKVTGQYDVTTTLIGINNQSFDWALYAALNDNSPVSTIRLNITVPDASGNTLVKLTSYLPTISFGNLAVKTLIIEKHPSLPANSIQGFDLSTFTVLPTPGGCIQVPGWCWWPPTYGFIFDNNVQSSVIIRNLKFFDANKYGYKFLNNSSLMSVAHPGFFPTTQPYPACGDGGPGCIYVANTKNFTVQNCVFENYISGITYKKVEFLRIENNLFTTDAKYGPGNCQVRETEAAIIHRDRTQNAKVYDSQILTNTIQATPSNIFHDGTGIIIEPFEWYTNAGDNQLQNIPAKLNFNILGNKIKNSWFGISQTAMQPIRQTHDLTYNLNIENNEFLNATNNISIGGPYRHFILKNNTLNLQSVYFNAWNNFLTNTYSHSVPSFLALGTFSILLVPGSPPTGGPYPILFPGPYNAFGFKMIFPNNTQNLAPFNHTNTFNFIPDPGFTEDPLITTFGNFDKEVDFIGLNTNALYRVFSGKNTNIRECKVNMNGYTNCINNSCFSYDNPISHYNYLFSNPPAPTFVPSNGNLSSPTLKSARITNNLLKVAFDLTGTSITPSNGPFVVEFFRSNIKGELVDFIGKQTINTLTNATYSLTVVPPIALTLIPGDRIGTTLTSLGTNNNPVSPLGTSTVSYIYTTPCNDCISDFAPIPGKDYIVSCWTRSIYVPNITFNNCQIKISFYSSLVPNPILIGTPILINQAGPMVDDWQKIEGKISVPANATGIKIEFLNGQGGGGTYVDDVRFFPMDATMKSYAYDPDNMRLMAELDERNYATFYEYDEEGKLIRVKKETEKGIMTIKESRNSKPTK
jgi:hypothetical protein